MKKIFALFCLFSFFTDYFSQDQDQVQYLNLSEAMKINPDSVFNLSLRKMKLDSVPFAIMKFKNLQKLDLSNNHLSEIPLFVSQLNQLEELEFSKNKFKQFPLSICALSKLKKLKFNRNEIDSLPVCISNLSNLHYLDFWDNPLKFYPEELIQLENLKEIHAEGIRYGPKFQEKWIRSMPKTRFFFDQACDCVE